MIEPSGYGVGNSLADRSQQQVHYRVMIYELIKNEPSVETFNSIQ